MKKIYLALISIVITIGLSMPAFCADATLNLDVMSAYVSRGFTYNDGMVLQPSLDVVKGGFDINIWGNMNMTDYHRTVDTNEFSELDLYVGYTKTIDKLSITGGIYQYIYPPMDKPLDMGQTPEGPNTEELYVNGTLDMGSGLSLSLSSYYDIDSYKDVWYSTLGLGYTYSPNKKLSINPSITAGYVKRPEMWGKSGFKDYKASLKATYSVTDTIGIGANINYVDSLDTNVLNSTNNSNVADKSAHTFGGVSVNCKF